MANEPRLAVESIAGQRPYQEDSVLADNLADGRVLVAVADGMGGHAAGEVASALALETLVSTLESGDPLDVAFSKSNAEVHEKANEPGKRGMGTTLVAALVEDGEYMVANVGDSRGYVLSANGIRQITHDHSFAAEAERHGQPIAEEMAIRYKDALTRSIGTEGQVEIDVFGPFPVQDDIALLICSDGLYKTLEDEDLWRIFAQSSGPRGAVQALVAEASERGSDDNISAVIAEYGEVPRTANQGTMPIDFVSRDDPEPVADADESPDDGGTEETEVADASPEKAVDSDSTAIGWDPVPASDPAPSAVADPPASAGPPVVAIVAAVVVIGALIALAVF